MAIYYISPSGSDSNNGLSPATAWQTIAKVNATAFVAGDFALFEGGQVFVGGVIPTTSGTTGSPITIGSYGTGRATISTTTLDGVLLQNVSGYVIRDLIVTGAGVGVNTKSGINLYNSTGSRMAQAVTIRNCTVSAFEYGIVLGGDTTGWTDVLIQDCTANGNQMAGIASYGDASFTPGDYSNVRVTVRGCVANNNLGDAALGTTSGSGIVLGSVSTGLIELCSATGNGSASTASEGPVGIWAFDSTGVVIQRCVSYSNRTNNADGGGYDLDQNCTFCTIQYCLAYDNDGPGLLISHAPATANWNNNTFRYNISWGNCRKQSTYGELHIFGTCSASEIYNNTLIAKTQGAVNPTAVAVGTFGTAVPTNIRIRNNLIVQLGTANLMQAASAWTTGQVICQGNLYYRPSGFSITWSSTFTSLAAWRASVTGQEQVSGTNVGIVADPLLINPSAQPTVTDPKGSRAIPALRPGPGSPALGAALNMFTTFSVNPGTSDYEDITLAAPFSVGATGLAFARQVLWEIDPLSEDPANSSLALTDSTFRLRADGGMDLTPPDIDPIYATSADTEGDPFVGSRHRNRTITLSLLARGATDGLTQTAIYQVQQKVDKLRREGGTLKCTTQAGTEIAFDVVFARFKPEFTAEYYALNKAVPFTLEFECKPYGRGAQALLPDHAETANPYLVFTETSLAGDVPGLGKLVIDEDQGADQAWMVWGMQSRYAGSASSDALVFKGEFLTPLGGSSNVSGAGTGSWATNILGNTNLTNSYVAMCSSQAVSGGAHWSHVGTFRVFARMQIPATNTGTANVALEWSEGDFRRFNRNTDVTFPVEPLATYWGGRWRLCDLGQVHLTKTTQGTQRWEARILAKSSHPGDDIYLDYVMLVPADEGSGEVSISSKLQTPTVFGGRDEFDSLTAGGVDLNGQTAPVGGTWAAHTGFNVYAVGGSPGNNVIITGNTGTNVAVLGTATYTNVLVEVDTSLEPGSGSARATGVAARYVDSSNYFIAAYTETTNAVYAIVRIAGVDTFARAAPFTIAYNVSYRISAQVDASGRGAVYFRLAGASSAGSPILQFYSPELATGGALASGKSGIYDFGSTTSLARTYDNFLTAAITKDAAVFASQSLELRDDRVIREDSGGTVWQRPSGYEGDFLVVPPAGKEGRSVRFIVKACRNDPDTMPDPAIDDISARLMYTPRYLALPS